MTDAKTARSGLTKQAAGRPMMTWWVLVAAAAAAAAPSGNMNGDYIVNSGAGKSAPHFNSDYASKGHEYFDVWSPELATSMPQRVQTLD